MKFLVFAAVMVGALATEGSYMSPGSGSAANVQVEVDVLIIGKDMGGGKGWTQLNTASAGDKVNFMFMSQNHTMTQSAFDKPCVKMHGGADSGFMPNPDNSKSPAPSMMFEVKTAGPIWFYCKQKKGTHCGKGMVFSINPTAEKSHEKFKEMAMQQNGTMTSSAPMMAASTASMTSTMASMPPMSSVEMTTATMSMPMPASATGMAAGAVAAPGSTIVQGSGSGSGESCSCSCLCAVNGFPAGDGLGGWGGYGGSMPAPWAMSSSAVGVEAASASASKPYR
ncbi:MAG: hypothetical protein M1826_006516 [Phylliscum demangeonii]|nr:MAG: hypothetical protein M1826_006516 [Phylliscum demangeonii]